MKKRLQKIMCIVFACTALLQCIYVSAAAEVNIAEFKYTGGTAEQVFDGTADSGYGATGGMLQSSARMYGSVNGTDCKEFEWSKAEYYYNGSAAQNQVVPIIAASADCTWGKKPYLLVEFSTESYENIKLSAKVNGTKKGPANYRLQYSTDNKTFTDVKDSSGSVVKASIPVNKNKDLDRLFENISLPAETEDCGKVFVRIIADDTKNIGGNDFTSSKYANGGEIAFNDIIISGEAKTVQKLPAPVPSIANGSEIYSDAEISFSCAAAEAVIKYTVNGGGEQIYTEALTPFKTISGSSAEITAWAEAEGFTASDKAVFIYTCTKDNIVSFKYDTKEDMEYVNGKARAVSGTYPNGIMTASADGNRKYVPLYDTENGPAAVIAPDDEYTWGEDGYWQFEISTAGYNEVYFTADALSSKKGPASMTLKYSTDGVKFVSVSDSVNKPLPTGNALGRYYDGKLLPAETADKEKVYIRLVMEEDARVNGTALFGGEANGNTYINNVVFAGARTDTPKMPYTMKKTDYFGLNGTVEYVSPDGFDMYYSIYDKYGNEVVSNQKYDETAEIALAELPQFDPSLKNAFTINIYAVNGEAVSVQSSKTYTYKGDIIAEYAYDGVTESQPEGLTLSMLPSGSEETVLKYNSSTTAVRASAAETNAWQFDKTRANPDGDGYWLITVSTKGYKDITFSAKQMSTEKGPRDFCMSYSVDGNTYNEIDASNIRVSESLESTYGNIRLPSEANDREILYIKIKIDGGETVSGVELDGKVDDLATSVDEAVYGEGHTGINNIEICGTKIEDKIIIDTDEEALEKGKTYLVRCAKADESAVVITAVYNGDTLVECRVNPEKLTVPSDKPSTYVKAMLWKSMESAAPTVQAVVKPVK